MPDFDEMFSKLAEQKFFSKINMSKGYWQVTLIESSKQKTSFKTEKGYINYVFWVSLQHPDLSDLDNVDNSLMISLCIH